MSVEINQFSLTKSYVMSNRITSLINVQIGIWDLRCMNYGFFRVIYIEVFQIMANKKTMEEEENF